MDPLTILRLIIMFVIGFGLWTLLYVGWLRLRAWWWRWTSPAPLPDPEPTRLVAVGAVLGDRVFVSVPPGPVGALPASAWRPDVVAWEASLDDLDAVRLELAARGVGLLLVRVPESRRPTSESWAADMFAALPPELHESVRRALAKVLHPDKGGDAAAFRSVTDASLHAGRAPASRG